MAVDPGACGRVVVVADRVSDIWRRRRSAATSRDLRLFTEFLTDKPATAGCRRASGSSGRACTRCRSCTSGTRSRTCNRYEGNPEARPFTREELQRFLDYADDQVERAVRAKRKGRWPPTGTRRCSR